MSRIASNRNVTIINKIEVFIVTRQWSVLKLHMGGLFIMSGPRLRNEISS